MIVDGHAYCFPPLGEASGFRSVRLISGTSSGRWRTTTSPSGDSRSRARQQRHARRSRRPHPPGLRDVGFRPGGYGRFVWRADGASTRSSIFPRLADLSHTPEMLVAQMDYAGVDSARPAHRPPDGRLTEFLAECVRRHPTRLLGLANVAEWEIERDPEGAMAEVRHAYGLGLHGYQFTLTSRYRHGVTGGLGWAPPSPVLGRRGALGKPIFFTLTPWPRRRSTTTSANRTVAGVARALPGGPRGADPRIPVASAPWRAGGSGCPRAFSSRSAPQRAAPAPLPDQPRQRLGIPVHGAPHGDRAAGRHLGSDRLIWGTDMPNVERFCTYRQTLEAFTVHCRGLITDQDIANIVGGTTARLFGFTA